MWFPRIDPVAWAHFQIGEYYDRYHRLPKALMLSAQQWAYLQYAFAFEPIPPPLTEVPQAFGVPVQIADREVLYLQPVEQPQKKDE